MRILYVTAGAGDMFCGSCLRDACLVQELQKQGAQVLFVPLYTPLRLEGGVAPAKHLFYGGVNVYLQDRYRLFRKTPRFIDGLFDAPPLLRFAARFRNLTNAAELADMTISVLQGRDGRQVKELERLLEWLEKQERPDVVVLANTLLSGLAPELRKRLGAPVLSHLSGEELFIEEFPEAERKRTREALARQIRSLDALIAPSKWYARFMSEYLDLPIDRFRHVPLGVDVAGFPPAWADPKKHPPVTVGFLSRICPQKGLHRLVDVFRILKQTPDRALWRLEAAGYLGREYQGYLEAVQKRVHANGLQNTFQYHGELDRSAKVQFFSKLHVFCLPSESPEPKGLPVGEALAAGVPVVVPPKGCLPEWIETTGGGLVAEADEPEAIAEAVATIMRDPELAMRLSKQGRAAVRENRTTAHAAAHLTKLLEAVVAHAAAPAARQQGDGR